MNGAEAEFETNNPLPMRGGLTIDVYIPQGILSEPGPITKFFWFIAGNPIVFLTTGDFYRNVPAVVVQRARSGSWRVSRSHVRTAARDFSG